MFSVLLRGKKKKSRPAQVFPFVPCRIPDSFFFVLMAFDTRAVSIESLTDDWRRQLQRTELSLW